MNVCLLCLIVVCELVVHTVQSVVCSTFRFFVSNMWEMFCLVAHTNLTGREDGEGLAVDVRLLLHTLWLCVLISK